MQKLLRFNVLSLLAFMVLFSAGKIAAQGSISGQVTDRETGEELIGVNVIIPSLNIGDATDIDGMYQLTNVPAGEYRIEARFVGFTTVRSFPDLG